MRYLCLLGLCVFIGCGPSGPTPYPVTGVVTLHGKTQDGVAIRFLPDGNPEGQAGNATTDAEGKFEVMSGPNNSRKGLAPGTYKVVMTRMRRADGTPPPPDVPPIESDAQETIPEPYSSLRDTPLKATIKAEPNVVELHLPLKK